MKWRLRVSVNWMSNGVMCRTKTTNAGSGMCWTEPRIASWHMLLGHIPTQSLKNCMRCWPRSTSRTIIQMDGPPIKNIYRRTNTRSQNVGRNVLNGNTSISGHGSNDSPGKRFAFQRTVNCMTLLLDYSSIAMNSVILFSAMKTTVF